MGTNQDTSYTIKPMDTASKIPNIIAFIIYRILPTGSLSFFLYKTLTEIALDWDQFARLLYLLNISVILMNLGMFYSWKYDCIILEELDSRQVWLDALNSNIETWVKGNGPSFRFLRLHKSEKKHIQYEKEALVAYLAGSRQGIPPPFSRSESYYQMMIYLVYTYIVLRLASADLLPAFAQFAMWSSIFLWLPTSFPFGRQMGWYGSIGCAVQKIRKECKSIDVEKGGFTRKQLEWWIKAILEEEPDSDALAEERMEIKIVPLLEAVRC
jgi:hypothetical protein